MQGSQPAGPEETDEEADHAIESRLRNVAKRTEYAAVCVDRILSGRPFGARLQSAQPSTR